MHWFKNLENVQLVFGSEIIYLQNEKTKVFSDIDTNEN